MKYLSVCSGIEAATQAWHSRGWAPVAFSEIEPFPSAVLAYHYPAVPNWGDMTKFKDWPDEPIDLLVGGTPCQSFSVAGLRAGLADPRGNLMLTFGAIAGRYRPKWVVWENVPGVLSSNGGRDFGAFLGMLGELGYGVAYRVLDAQYVRTRGFPFAVPQRRRRVFVVGYLGDWRRAAAVLFERESLSGHPPPRREAGQATAPTLAARIRGGGGLGTDFDCDGGLIASTGDVSHCLNAGGMGRIDYETETMVAHALPPVAIQERAVSKNPDAGPDGVGVRQDGAAYTLELRTVPQAVAFSFKDSGNDATADCSPTLRSLGAYGANGGSQMAIALPWAVRRLTPREAERLQAFPDDFTRIPYRGKPADQCPDGPRYKALGNSMAVNVMDWIGDRIAHVESIIAATAAERTAS